MANEKPSKPFWRRLLKWTLYFVLFLFIIGSIAAIILYQYFSQDLPEMNKLEDYRPALVSEVFDSDGKKIGEFWKEYRFLTPYQDIPEKMVQAFVASEDDNFFSHHGVDPMGIARAFVTNLKAGHVVQGGSTITQQLAKNLVLTSEKSYKRKFQEAIIATKIESKFSKSQILYMYLNHIFLGNRAYGIAAASKNYFHKELKELNVAEIAMIVGLSKGPSEFDPLKKPARARQRQHYVLDRMVVQKYITEGEANAAKQTELKLYRADAEDKDFNMRYTPYFTEQVRRILVEKYGIQRLLTEGWKIHTTASLDMQKSAEKAVNKGVREVDYRQGLHEISKHLISKTEIEQFNLENHKKIIKEVGEVFILTPQTNDYAAVDKTPLRDGKYYDAVVLSGSRSKGFEVQVGTQIGTVLSSTMGWAGGGADRIKPGDVIQVKLYKKTQTAELSKKKNSKQEPKVESPVPIAENKISENEKPLFSLEQEPALQGALFSYEPYTGEVKAMIGGTDYRKSEFNRATQALRQPGSSIKPLIYAAALDKGYTPNTIILDTPLVYDDGSGKPWEPKNSGGGFSGATTFRAALAHSRNVPTVRIVMDIGTHYIDAYMRKMGIESAIQKFYSIALGASEVYLAELARAYGTFANGGILPELIYIKKVEDPLGNIIEENKGMDPARFVLTWDAQKQNKLSISQKIPDTNSSSGELAGTRAQIPETQLETMPETMEVGQKAKNKKNKVEKIPFDEIEFRKDLIEAGEKATAQDKLTLSDYEKKILYGNYIPEGYIITPRTAATMVSIMQDVVKYGTATRVLALGKPAAGKTGTTNDSTDAWFIGYTPTLLTGVWVGHDEKVKSIGHGATGGQVSAPIWLTYMIDATKRYPTKDFKLPPWLDLSQYQSPMELIKGDTESADFSGSVPTGIAAPPKKTSGAEFFSNDEL